jgi:hypothetical protein
MAGCVNNAEARRSPILTTPREDEYMSKLAEEG